ncbi:MAG TPA: hypothetical protein VK537_08095 [Galbitalea sp.]|nr:hypothetical protein [Galbitalea sp.]
MTHGVGVLRFAPIIAVVALLAGCATATPPSTSHSATPTPPPRATAASAPGSRVPLKCSDLFTPSSVAVLVGAPVQVFRDETTPPGYLYDVANAELGVLGCEWAGDEGSEAGYFADVTVYIAPDSGAGFQANYSSDLAESPANAGSPVENTAGDKSGYRCAAQGRSDETPLCTAQMLVGSYWVTVDLSAVAPATAVTASVSTQKVLTRVVAQLHAVGLPKTTAWVAPASTPPGFCTDPGRTAEVRTIMDAPGLVVFPSAKRSFDATTIASERRDVGCMWTDPAEGYIGFDLLAGGSWVFPGWEPTPASDAVVDSYAPVTVPGASSALMGSGGGACEAYLAVGTTAVEISMNDLGTAKNIAALSAFATAIAAS